MTYKTRTERIAIAEQAAAAATDVARRELLSNMLRLDRDFLDGWGDADWYARRAAGLRATARYTVERARNAVALLRDTPDDAWAFNNPMPGHQPRVSIKKLGGSPIKGMRGHSGTNLRCSCGWSASTNEGPPSSKAGKALTARYVAHLRDDVLTPPHLVLRDELMPLDRQYLNGHHWDYDRRVRSAYAAYRERVGRRSITH